MARPIANEYDKILRETFRQPKHNLLKELLRIEAVSIKPVTSRMQQTILEWEADTVLDVVTTTGENCIVHIEWQSTNDAQMAFRMARYDLLLFEMYGKEVMGLVIYVGMKKMTMKDVFFSSGIYYCCPMVDIRDISPQVFLSSDDAGEVVLAILAGREEKEKIIREILHRLRIITDGDTTLFREKVKHLEVISRLRGTQLQHQIIKEEENMPVTLDIKQDLRYKQGKKEGKKEGGREEITKIAVKMLENGMSLPLIQRITGVTIAGLKELQNKLED